MRRRHRAGRLDRRLLRLEAAADGRLDGAAARRKRAHPRLRRPAHLQPRRFGRRGADAQPDAGLPAGGGDLHRGPALLWYNFGIDPIGLVRAAVVNLRAGHIVEGGSTLTQQLAKNLFLKPERTFERKVQEMIMAVWLQLHLSKKQILDALPQPGLFRRRRLWRRRRRASLFRQVGAQHHAGRSGDAGRHAEGAGDLFAGDPPGGGRGAHADRARRHARRRLHHQPPGEPGHVDADHGGARRGRRQRPLRRRLDHGPAAAICRRPDRPGHHRRHHHRPCHADGGGQGDLRRRSPTAARNTASARRRWSPSPPTAR